MLREQYRDHAGDRARDISRRSPCDRNGHRVLSIGLSCGFAPIPMMGPFQQSSWCSEQCSRATCIRRAEKQIASKRVSEAVML